MKKYLKISINEILRTTQYRFNFFTKLSTYIIDVLIIILMWKGIFFSSNKNIISGYTEKEMLSYIIIVGFIHYIYNFMNIKRLSGLVYTGKLSTLLIRPINIVTENFFFYLGERIFIFSTFIIILSIYKLFFVPKYYFLTLILVILCFIMYFYLTFLISTLSFWMYQTWPLIGLFNGIYFILSGSFFPLDLLPQNIYSIVKYNPFGIVAYGVTKTIQANLGKEEILYYIIASFLWLCLFSLLCKITLKNGLKRYEGMGA